MLLTGLDLGNLLAGFAVYDKNRLRAKIGRHNK